MKKICILSIFYFTALSLNAQSSKNSKDLDVPTANEILKLLPDKIKDKDANKDKDNVKDKSGFIGVTAYRNYGQAKKDDVQKNIYIEIINYSPSLPVVNSILSKIGSVSSGQYIVTVIDGYPGLIQKVYSEDGTGNYEMLLPMYVTLLTLKAPGYTLSDFIVLANTISIGKIAKLVEKPK